MSKTIHDEKGIIVPQWLKDVGVDFPRDITKIHGLKLLVEKMNINELEWHLDMPFFWEPNAPFSLRPREVLKNPQAYKYHMDKIIAVDTSYPIDIIWWKGKWEILDGLHRLCKQVLEGKLFVMVRKIPHSKIKNIMPDY